MFSTGEVQFLIISPSVVAMVSMAFGIVGLGACLCCKDVDSKMTNKVRYNVPCVWIVIIFNTCSL
jgi:hypothetical protein